MTLSNGGAGQRIADEYGLADNFVGSTAITGMEWDEAAGRWAVSSDKGDTFMVRKAHSSCCPHTPTY